MTERFEEDLGRYAYITLPQLKDYLSISSNTQDARLANLISYATGVVEHYIGQEILANNYTEIFDGGSNAVFVSRLPLSNVYQVTEFTGSDYNILTDPSTIGTATSTSTDSLSLSFYNSAALTTKVKNFGKSSLSLGVSDYVASTSVPSSLSLDESDFTIEMFIRIDKPTIQNNTIFSINTDSSNYLTFNTSNQYGLSFEANIAGNATTVTGANTSVESQQFTKRRWAHVAVSRDLTNERLYLHYNGNTIANSEYLVEDHTFTSNVLIGETFQGYIDELRVSTIARYSDDFTVPTNRFRPDEDTSILVHFDGANMATNASDVSRAAAEYTFSRDTGKITRESGTLSGISLYTKNTFQPYPNGIKVEYRAGYEPNNIPFDIQLATLDFIKILYKQDQEKKGFSFEGERGESFSLSSNFPPHVRRVLDMYRIIK